MNSLQSEQPLKLESANDSLIVRIADTISCPEDVMERIALKHYAVKHWVVPILLTVLASYFCLSATSENRSTNNETLALENLILLADCFITSFGGALWSALVLWLLSRWALQARFRFHQALEVVGSTSTIAALGWIVTLFLRAALDNSQALPALSLLLSEGAEPSKWHRILDSLNLFHIWSTMLFALGLARLSRCSFAEAAFWTIGYWIVLPAALS